MDKFDDFISNETLAAYIDGNATEEEQELIEGLLPSDEMLLETTEIVNDFYLLETNVDWDSYDNDTTDMDIPIDYLQECVMGVEAFSEPPEINFELPFSNLTGSNDDLPSIINETDEEAEGFDI